MFIQIFLPKESFLYQRILNQVKDGLLLFVSMGVMIPPKNWLKETTQLITMRLLNLQTRDSLFMHPKILTAEKMNTDGSIVRQIPLRKHFSHLLFPNTTNLFNGYDRFLLLMGIELLFMARAMEEKLL